MLLTPPRSANENSPLATRGGGSSVRLGALPYEQSPGRHTEHETLATVLSRMVNVRRPVNWLDVCSTFPCQSPLKSNVAGEAYVNSLLAARPHRSVRITSTVPAAWAGVDSKWIGSSCVHPSTPKGLAMPPTVTVAAHPTPVPLMDTGVPPLVDPMFGTTSLMTGGATYKNPEGTLACARLSGLITVTFTFPAACAGIAREMAVALRIVASTRLPSTV